MVIEKVTGQSYADYMRKQLFDRWAWPIPRTASRDR
jgi:hypothetical protein